jgi:hypothetical protein
MTAQGSSEPGSRREAVRGRWWLAAALAALAVGAEVLVWVPLRILRPFAPQTGAGLARAFEMQRVAPAVTLVALVLGAALAWRLWRSLRWVGRLGVGLALAVLCTAAWMARQDIFEKMFRPLPRPGYLAAADADFVAPDDMVLAIAADGDAAAYPVRQIAYHHVVMDVVGGTPVAVTY